MNTYTSRANTPLAFHNFIRFFSLPIGIITWLTRFSEFSNIEQLNWLYVIDFIFFTTAVVLLVLAFIGFLRWQLYGYKCLFIYLVVVNVFYLVCMAIYAAFNLTDEVNKLIGTEIVNLTYSVILFIYYRKRRQLFTSVFNKVNLTNNLIKSDFSATDEMNTLAENTIAKIEPEAGQDIPIKDGNDVIEQGNDNVKAKYCRKCGSRLEDDSRFCSLCGTEVISLTLK